MHFLKSNGQEKKRQEEEENLNSNKPPPKGVCLLSNIFVPFLCMKYILQGKNIELTIAINDLIASKIKILERLTKRFDQEAIEARVEVGKPSRHHRSGPIFYAEINLKLPSRLLRAEANHLDLNFAINEAFKEIERQIKKYKEKKIEIRN